MYLKNIHQTILNGELKSFELYNKSIFNKLTAIYLSENNAIIDGEKKVDE